MVGEQTKAIKRDGYYNSIEEALEEIEELETDIRQTWHKKAVEFFDYHCQTEKILHDAFIEETVKANPEWAKSVRLEYLSDQINSLQKDLGDVNKLMKGLAESKTLSWLNEYVFEYVHQPIIKKLKKFRIQKTFWEESWRIRKGEITQQDIGEVESVDCKYFLDIKRHDGQRSWAVCPFHDDHSPSLCCFGSGKGWYCFACSSGGGAIELVKKLHNLNFIEAVKYIKSAVYN